ncbi:MAG: DUF1097 domain-containing protein [Quadrisphaera sp.]
MKRLLALGVSIGVLAGVLTWVGFSIPEAGTTAAVLVVWVGFAAWALFYAAGGGTGGLAKTVASTISGVVWGWLIIQGATAAMSGNALVLGIAVAVGAFGMCVQAAWKPLAFIPGAFVGAACFFGTGATGAAVLASVVSLVVGALLAFASEKGADVIEPLLGKEPAPAPTASRHA